MSLDFVEAIPSRDRLTQSCCPFHRERLAEGCRPESEKVQALPTRSTTQLRIQSPVSSDTPPLGTHNMIIDIVGTYKHVTFMAPGVSTATGWRMKRRPNSAYLAIFLTSATSATDPAASAARIRFVDANVLTHVASKMPQRPRE